LTTNTELTKVWYCE